MNCVGAVKLARNLGPGHTIATILCDGGQRYAFCPASSCASYAHGMRLTLVKAWPHLEPCSMYA